jgi:uncharacterized OB-fold protein
LKVISNAWNDTLRVVLFGEIRRLAKISYRFNSIDFGSVYVGRDLDRGLMIYNVGSDTLRITGISVRDSVRFRYVGSLPLNVVMGDSVELKFRFRPDGSGSWVDSVLIRNNSVNDSLFKLVLRGRGVRPPYLSSVDSVNFGLVVFGDSLSKSIWVKNTGEIDTVRIIKIETGSPFYVRGISKMALPPGDSSKIDLVLRGDSLGSYNSVLKVISNAWNDTLRVVLFGEIRRLAKISYRFNSIDFGSVYVGRDLDRGLMIYNVGSDTLRITGISVRDSVRFRYVGSLPLNVVMGDSVELKFRFRPDGSGSWVDSVLIRNNSVNDSLFKLVLRGRGVRPPYLSSVDSVNFGLVVFGDSLSKSIWVKNTGEIDTVRIIKIETGSPFYVRGISKMALPPGDSSKIDLVLRGDSLGSYNSVLKVISNAWNDTLRVVLFGEIRRLAKISYRFNSIDFGSVYVGRDLDRGLMIYNVGSDTLRITGISVRDSVRFRYVGSLPLNVVMGDSVELKFRFRPDGSGSWVDSVLIRNNSVNDSLFKLVLRGRGVRPPYLSSVDSVNFGLVVFGDSLSKSLWVKNTGEIDTVRIIKSRNRVSILCKRNFKDGFTPWR